MVNKKEFLLYTIAGTTGTVIYFFARFTSKGMTDSVLLPVIIGQVCAIVFSFFANKYFVFKNNGTSFKETCQQFFEFCMGRLFVFALDLGIAYFFVDKYHHYFIHLLRLQRINYASPFFANSFAYRYMGNALLLNEFIFTVISQILATVINYVVSKKIVFRIQEKSHEAFAS